MPNPFEHVVPDDLQLDRMQRLREGFDALNRLIQEVAPITRERALAITNLEQAAMWANKAIAHEHAHN